MPPLTRRSEGGAATEARTEAVLEASHVCLRYGEGPAAVDALQDVSLKLDPGAFVALKGPSGSGKTSLLHCLGGLQVPTSGEVLWNGRRLESLDADTRASMRRTDLGYVFQGGNLIDSFTAEQNVSFAIFLAGRGSEPGLARKLLDRVGLESKADSLPSELSGGQQQRVALARALAQRPRVLLADEPTGHLDSETAKDILELVARLHDEEGLTVVLATHDTAVAERAGLVYELVDGRLQPQ